MANNKLTKKDYYAKLATLVENSTAEDKDALLTFIAHEVDLLSKKASNKAPTKTQKENENIKTEIISALKALGRGVTVSELQLSAPTLSGYSNQKISALLKQLSDDKVVEKTADKKRTLFKA